MTGRRRTGTIASRHYFTSCSLICPPTTTITTDTDSLHLSSPYGRLSSYGIPLDVDPAASVRRRFHVTTPGASLDRGLAAKTRGKDPRSHGGRGGGGGEAALHYATSRFVFFFFPRPPFRCRPAVACVEFFCQSFTVEPSESRDEVLRGLLLWTVRGRA